MFRLISLVLWLCLPTWAASDIVGLVTDRQSNKPLMSANVMIQEGPRGTSSDKQGRFTFHNLKDGTYHLTISFIGYQPFHGLVRVGRDTSNSVTISLSPMLLDLPEMVVTSTKFDKQLEDVSLPITVVRSEQIDRQAPIGIANLLHNEPGISLGRDGMWGTFVSIRGLARNSIVTLIDGYRVDTANDLAAGLSLIDVNDIQRVEVIKGAASSLYGSGAMGGVINIITKGGWYQDRPYFKANMISGFTSVNQSGMGKFAVNLGNQRWYVHASAMMRKANDAKTPSGILNSQYQDQSVSSRIGFRPHLHHELNLTYQRYYATDVGIPGGYPIFPDNADVRYPKEERELFSAEYRIHDLSAKWLKTSIKYFFQNILRDVENIPHIVNTVPAGNGQPPKRVSVLKILPGATHDTRGVQIQSDWHWRQYHYIIWGVDGWQKKYQGYRAKESKIEVLDPISGAVQKTFFKTTGELPIPNAFYRSLGAYGQYELHTDQERLQITLGARYDRIQVENEQGLNPLYDITDGVRSNTPAGQKVLWSAQKASDRSWSANLGVLYKLYPSFDVTLNMARAFRSPFLEERYQYIDLGSLVKVGDPHLKPENGHFYDLGIRYVDEIVQTTANIFYNRLLNMVGEIPGTYDNRNALIKTNIGKAELYGGEISNTVTLHSRYSVWIRGSYVVGQDLLLGQPLAQIPPFHGGIGLQLQPGNLGTLDISATKYARQDRVAQGEFTTPGYTYFDIYFNSRPMRFWALTGRIMVGVENITNKDYRNHLATNRGLITSEPGRNVLLRYQMEF